MMDLDISLKQIQDELGFTYKQEGSQYRLFIDEDLSLWIKRELAGIRLWCDLVVVPEENRLEVLKLVMRANLFGQGTGKGIISLDGASNYLTYSIDYPWEIRFDRLKDLIEEISNYKEYWQKAITLEQ